jgi:hypothetical protein
MRAHLTVEQRQLDLAWAQSQRKRDADAVPHLLEAVTRVVGEPPRMDFRVPGEPKRGG